MLFRSNFNAYFNLKSHNFKANSTSVYTLSSFAKRPHFIYSIWYYYRNAGFWRYSNIKRITDYKKTYIIEKACIRIHLHISYQTDHNLSVFLWLIFFIIGLQRLPVSLILRLIRRASNFRNRELGLN